MSGIVIVDEEFKVIAEEIKKQSEETETTVDSLIEVFESITTELAVEGNVAENFQILKEEIGSLKGQFTGIYNEVSQVVEEFINEVDAADEFLY